MPQSAHVNRSSRPAVQKIFIMASRFNWTVGIADEQTYTRPHLIGNTTRLLVLRHA